MYFDNPRLKKDLLYDILGIAAMPQDATGKPQNAIGVPVVQPAQARRFVPLHLHQKQAVGFITHVALGYRNRGYYGAIPPTCSRANIPNLQLAVSSSAMSTGGAFPFAEHRTCTT